MDAERASRVRGQSSPQPVEGSVGALLLELKMKDADNNYLHEEVRRLRDHLREKEGMLTMLTEGLKEVRSTRRMHAVWEMGSDNILLMLMLFCPGGGQPGTHVGGEQFSEQRTRSYAQGIWGSGGGEPDATRGSDKTGELSGGQRKTVLRGHGPHQRGRGVLICTHDDCLI
jgi:hypothetical protein